ncbi:hypothetical protein E4U50_000769 [Claviceps purpurea]|nr:hypothetical protein E4U11_007362 [Claviceps purpurea]KAG6213955.1 hypothetical protein E4U50_000769 [Claviceps purpurea]
MATTAAMQHTPRGRASWTFFGDPSQRAHCALPPRKDGLTGRWELVLAGVAGRVAGWEQKSG